MTTPSAGTILSAAICLLASLAFGQAHDHAMPAMDHSTMPTSGVEASKQHEQHNLLALVPAEDADVVAAKSGRYADTATWVGAKTPSDGSFVFIPEGVRVEVASDESGVRVDRMRVDGELVFSSSASTALKVTTLVIGENGRLEMGTAQSPIRRDAPATLIIGDRGVRDRAGDPSDLTGGLLSQGVVSIRGEKLTPFAQVLEVPKSGDRIFRFARSPSNWRVDDLLLVPGTSFKSAQDEVVRIVGMSEGEVRFEPALRYDRWIPAEVDAQLPIGNLTRSVEIRSETIDPVGRGHIMLMHRATGHDIEYARFNELGRTRAAVAHTIPTRDEHGGAVPGSDENTIGRYALHFHVRNGASADLPPHVVEGCVITGSPKHGLVNHGGNVIARDNVTFRIDGSHFFTENGTEMGRFEHNLAVRSAGSGDRTLSRDGANDFGHGGHGFWMQSPLIKVHNNFAFGHAESGFAYLCNALSEGGEVTSIRPDQVADARVVNGLKELKPQGIPISFSRNTSVASESGFVFWDVMSNPKHEQWSVVSDCVGWALRSRGLWVPYVSQTVFRDIVLIRGPEGYGGVGVIDNRTTHDLKFERVHLAGFDRGVTVPKRGTTEIRDCTLANRVNVHVLNGERHARRLIVENPRFEPFGAFVSELDYEFEPVVVPQSGNIAAMLLRSEFVVTGDPRLEGRQLYVHEQAADHVPVTVSENAELDGRTNAQLWAAHELAVYGAVAPADAAPVSFTNALVGSPVAHAPLVEDDAWPRGLARTGEPQYAALPGETEGWFLSSVEQNGTPTTLLEYIDATPGYVDLDPRMPKAIHPDDVQYGVEVRVFMFDTVGTAVVAGNGVNYVPGDKISVVDGKAIVPYTVCDRAGHEKTYYYQFDVTEDAPRRMRNTSFFRQSSIMGEAAERDVFYGPFPKDDRRYLPDQNEYEGHDHQGGHDNHP